MKRISVGWQQGFRQTGTDQNADEKSGQQKRKNRTADFQYPACAPPPAALFIVEYGLAWLHTFIPTLAPGRTLCGCGLSMEPAIK
jgi:hypothetical protein